MTGNSKLIVALDVFSKEQALGLVKALKDDIKIFKVGLELFIGEGPSIVEKIRNLGCEVFLDLKFYDIPNQVRRATIKVVELGVKMFTLHVSGGSEMLRETSTEVRKVAEKHRVEPPKVIGVTVLTSMSKDSLKEVGIEKDAEDEVVTLAGLAYKAGLDGVIASALEIESIRKTFGKDFLIVTPGIRSGKDTQDQKRVLSPEEAIKRGADYIVVGRPIIESDNPHKAALEILEEIKVEIP